MSTTSTINTTRPPKKTRIEIAKATLRLRRKLEDSLFEFEGSDAEHSLIKMMIDLLYRLDFHDRDAEIIIDSIQRLTLGRRLRHIFLRPDRTRTSMVPPVFGKSIFEAGEWILGRVTATL
jgi:hypothetical protein